jgi:hypothetical protein
MASVGQMAGKGVGAAFKGGRSLWGKVPGGKIGKGMVGFAAFDMYSNIQGGDDVGTAAVKAGANFMLWDALPGPMTALTVAPALAQGAMAAGTFINKKQQWWNQQFKNTGVVGGQYIDTQRAQTMRQAAVQAIQGSKMNARSALGGEAKIFANNPFSPY